MEAFLQILSLIIALILFVTLGQLFGYSTLPKALGVGLVALLFFWFMTWFIMDTLSFLDRFFDCKQGRLPFLGRHKVCDYKNIPLIIGIFCGFSGVIMTFVEGYQKKRAEAEEEASAEQC